VRLRFTRAARTDLHNAIDYISQDSPRAARAFLAGVEKSTRRLVETPFMARAGRVTGTRELIIGRSPYIAVYTVAEDEITIIRLLHGHQDWPPR